MPVRISAMHTTSFSLLVRLGQPDQPRAWDRFVELYTPLFYYCSSKLGLNEAAAHDLVQEVFVALVNKLPQYRRDGAHKFRSWLRTVFLNKWRDQRRRTVPPRTNVATLDDLVDPDPADAVADAEYRQFLVRRALQV